LQSSVLEALEAKFDAVPDGLREVIQAISEETTLRDLLKAAVKTPSLGVFFTKLP